LENRDDCRRQNFDVAMNVLNNKIINPWEIYNFNTDLVPLQNDYCKDNDSWKYLFYWWVCGASTQIFRNALMNPFIEVEERHPHSVRYVKWYNEYIFWDDAAIYERTKQFKIKNIWTKPIYFKVIQKNSKKYLISIYPSENKYFSHITKVQIDKTQAAVWKAIYELWTNKKWYDQYWKSAYNSRTWED
jgi:vancomycin resistance protein YoaR